MSYSLNRLGTCINVSALGNIGIGTLANNSNKLIVSTALSSASTNSFPIKISAKIVPPTLNTTGTFIALGTQDINYSKCAFGHVRTGANDQGDIVFLNRATADTASCDMTNEIMRITNSNVGIGKSNPNSLYKLDVNGNINATGYIIDGVAFSSSTRDWLSTANTLYTETNVKIGTSSIISSNALNIYGDVALFNTNISNTLPVWGETNNVVNYSGTVGISTRSPNALYKLDVNGTVNSSNLYVNGVLFPIPAANFIPINYWNKTGNDVWITSNVGIGTTVSSIYNLNVVGNMHVNGNMAARYKITAFASDIRLKTVIENIDNSLGIFNNLSVFKYKLNNVAKSYGLFDDKEHIGLSAQELQIVAPELVTIAPFDREYFDGNIISKSGETFLTIKYDKLIPFLVRALQQLSDRCKRNRKKILELENYLPLNVSKFNCPEDGISENPDTIPPSL